jgi:hypothetical protein
VIDKLKLADDPEFNADLRPPSFWRAPLDSNVRAGRSPTG